MGPLSDLLNKNK